jgi:tRNA pseudouridine55 synthase
MDQPKRQKRDISGWLVLDKPYDMTSTQAVGKVRWLFGAKKAGHAGTLDPLATGILPIALGEATKTVPNVQDGEKLYRFSVKWGVATATDDAEGDIVATSELRPSAEAITALLPRFTGEILQTPPAFSAIKVDGERAYDLARAGEVVVLEPRRVIIESFVLVEHGPEQSSFEVACQKGTYVRALARDLAEALGTKGHVVKLHRAAVGPFTDAISIDLAALEAATPEARDALLLPVAAALAGVPEIRLSAADAVAIRNGNAVLLTGAGAPIALDEAWASFRGQALAVGCIEHGQFKPRRVILGA